MLIPFWERVRLAIGENCASEITFFSFAELDLPTISGGVDGANDCGGGTSVVMEEGICFFDLLDDGLVEVFEPLLISGISTIHC